MKNLKKFLILTILVFCFLSVADSQRGDSNNKKKNKSRKQGKSTFTIKKHKKTDEADDKAQIQCLVCNAEFVMMDFNEAHRCYNPGLNASDTRRFLLSTCPYETKFCITEVVRIHGVLAAINRRCGGVFCVEACFKRSFGIERETCTFCCDGVQATHFQVIGDDDLISYQAAANEMNSNSIAQNTSSTRAVMKELKLKIQQQQMKTAYNCPSAYKTEY